MSKPKQTAFRVHPCVCGSTRLPVPPKRCMSTEVVCPDCGCLAPADGQVVVAWR